MSTLRLGRTFTTAMAAVVAVALGACSNGSSTGQPAVKPAADNTAVNQRDRRADEPTADQQLNDKSDLQLTAQIRRSIMADDSLSMDAHNVKIIAEHGVVTLKGPVKTATEKTVVEQKAVAVAGQANVKSEIAIAQ